jgi:hypothetical protein
MEGHIRRVRNGYLVELRTGTAWLADRQEDISSTLARKLIRKDPYKLSRRREVLTASVCPQLEDEAHLRVKEDPEVTRLVRQALPGRLIDPYKGVMVRKHLVKAAEDCTIE